MKRKKWAARVGQPISIPYNGLPYEPRQTAGISRYFVLHCIWQELKFPKSAETKRDFTVCVARYFFRRQLYM